MDRLVFFTDNLGPRWDEAGFPSVLVSPYDMGHLRTAVDRERTWMTHRMLATLILATLTWVP